MDVEHLAAQLAAARGRDDPRTVLLIAKQLRALAPELMYAAVEELRAKGATETEIAEMLDIRRPSMSKQFPPEAPRPAGRPPARRDG